MSAADKVALADLSGTPAGITALENEMDDLQGNFSTLQTAVGVIDGNLLLKAPLESASLTGLPTGPTVSGSTDDSTKLATTGFVQSVIRALINLAPAELDTLREIADRLSTNETSDAALVAVVTGKLTKSANLSDLTNVLTARSNLGLAPVAASGDYDDLDNLPSLDFIEVSRINQPSGVAGLDASGNFDGKVASIASLAAAGTSGRLGVFNGSLYVHNGSTWLRCNRSYTGIAL